MRTTLLPALALLAACTGPQPRLGPVAPENGHIPPGAQLWVTLDAGLSTRWTPIGTHFSGRVRDDVVDPAGRVLVPRGSVVEGQVTDARPEGGANLPATLRLEMLSLVMDGVPQPLTGQIVATDAVTRPQVFDPDAPGGAQLVFGGMSAELPAGSSLLVRLTHPVLPFASVRGGGTLR